jgi:phosphoheptose isomerase
VLETNYFVGGNGGSAADKSHFATEFVVRFTKDRPASAAICLCGDGGLLTAVGKRLCFEKECTSALGRAPFAVLPTQRFS